MLQAPIHPGNKVNRHLAVDAQDQIYKASNANRLLAEDNRNIIAERDQLALENEELKRVMTDPTIDANVGGIEQQAPTNVDPVQMLFAEVGRGTDINDLTEVGLVDQALQSMIEQGYTNEDVENTLAELDQLSRESVNSPYSFS